MAFQEASQVYYTMADWMFSNAVSGYIGTKKKAAITPLNSKAEVDGFIRNYLVGSQLSQATEFLGDLDEVKAALPKE